MTDQPGAGASRQATLRAHVAALRALVNETRTAHRSKDDSLYNGCEDGECAWCAETDEHLKALEAALSVEGQATLRALVEKWRDRQERMTGMTASSATKLCADELEAALLSAEDGRQDEQSEDIEVVNAVTAAMREADRIFEKAGGSTRHHVRDCLLPVLNRNGWKVVRSAGRQDETPQRIEMRLRRELWLGHGHGHDALYGDDGEMQCSRCMPHWDYKRMPIEDAIAAADKARLERLGESLASRASEDGRQDETQIECPLCGEVVKQVASATLSLALWQHCNWTCPKRAGESLASRAAAPPQEDAHRCSGCGHRWRGPLSGAELCGDCWRKGQSVILGYDVERPPDGSPI